MSNKQPRIQNIKTNTVQGKHEGYIALHHHGTVVRCINSNLAICQMDQALYPARAIKWCVYVLFILDEEQVKKYCKYTISKVEQNLALSLGGYLWAISALGAFWKPI